MTDAYTTIGDFPNYEIARNGEVRRAGGGPLKVHYSSSGKPFVSIRDDAGSKSRSINVLLVETFGPGAAEAAGYPEPNLTRVATQRELAKRPRSGMSLGEDSRVGKTRRCHDCGKPTTNYRCNDCWIKVRGFGMDGTERYHTDLYGV